MNIETVIDHLRNGGIIRRKNAAWGIQAIRKYTVRTVNGKDIKSNVTVEIEVVLVPNVLESPHNLPIMPAIMPINPLAEAATLLADDWEALE